MKKLILSVLFLLFVIPLFSVYATSGACSGHGGVNCSAGADFDGSVICNDGWTDSTVTFSNTSECRTNLVDLCPTPYLSGVYGSTDMSLCDQYQSACTATNAAMIQYQIGAGRGVTSSGNLNTISCPQADQCRQEVSRNNAALQNYNSCVEQAKQLMADEIKADQELQKAQKAYDSCANKYGPDTFFNTTDGSCGCTSGDFLDKISNTCRISNKANYTILCQEEFGDFSVVTPNDTSSCSCQNGYQFNSDKKCEKIITPEPVKSILVHPKPKVEKTTIKKEELVITPIEIQPVIQEISTSLPKPSLFMRIINWFKFW